MPLDLARLRGLVPNTGTMIRPGTPDRQTPVTAVSPAGRSAPMPMPAVTPTTAPQGMMGFFNNASSTPEHFLGAGMSRDERREARMARREARIARREARRDARRGI